jgi:hypothetical protein
MPQKKTPSPDRGPGQAQGYEIRLRGTIGPTLLEAFPTLIAGRRGPDTVLCGRLVDQSALYGVIHQLEALGLELLEVQRQPAPRRHGGGKSRKVGEDDSPSST